MGGIFACEGNPTDPSPGPEPRVTQLLLMCSAPVLFGGLSAILSDIYTQCVIHVGGPSNGGQGVAARICTLGGPSGHWCG